jgi:hypothetical protein
MYLFTWNNKYNEYNVTKNIYTLSSWSYARELTLCMIAFWSHEGVVFLDFLQSPHLVTSFLFPCLGSTDALCPRLGDPAPLPPKWHSSSQGPRTLPYRDLEQPLYQNLRDRTVLSPKVPICNCYSSIPEYSNCLIKKLLRADFLEVDHNNLF